MQDKLSKHITRFRKSHGTQHSLITILKKKKSALDKEKNICVLVMDLSKLFDTIHQDILLAKLKIYWFSIRSDAQLIKKLKTISTNKQ